MNLPTCIYWKRLFSISQAQEELIFLYKGSFWLGGVFSPESNPIILHFSNNNTSDLLKFILYVYS